MNYVNPNAVLTPKGKIKNLHVLHDGGEHSWSLARMTWDNAEVLAMRWNGGMVNGKKTSGNPVSRGYPTWFVVPDEVGQALLQMVKTVKGFKEGEK
ncbi:MAG: hypothetical protein WCG04_00480 [Alphaproteobacteria bacterium]